MKPSASQRSALLRHSVFSPCVKNVAYGQQLSCAVLRRRLCNWLGAACRCARADHSGCIGGIWSNVPSDRLGRSQRAGKRCIDFYLPAQGGAWRLLPNDLAALQTVYGYFIHRRLNAALHKPRANRKNAPPHRPPRSWKSRRSSKEAPTFLTARYRIPTRKHSTWNAIPSVRIGNARSDCALTTSLRPKPIPQNG